MPTFKLYAECISSFVCVVEAPTLRDALAKADGTPWTREEPGELGPVFAASDLDHGAAYNHTEILLAQGGFPRTSAAATPAEHAEIMLGVVKDVLSNARAQPPTAQLAALYDILSHYLRGDDLAAEPVKRPRRRRKAMQDAVR